MATSDEIAGLGRNGDRPRMNPGADLSRVQLTPTEGFVLSRIDGQASYDEVCKMSGLGREQTLAILRKLKQAHLILGPGEAAPPAAAAKANPPARAPGAKPAAKLAGQPLAPEAPAVRDDVRPLAQRKGGHPEAAAAPPMPSLLERLDDGSPVDASALAEGPDLPEETRMRIVRLHRRLRKLAPHELLGVEASADAATIKRAFAAASKELHPDRYFGKNLGSFRDKLAQIFTRVTEAAQGLQKARKGKG